MDKNEIQLHNWLMYIKRIIEKRLKELAQQFPAIAILGPRQSGKTTVAKRVFPHHKYINLEELDTRQFAIEDPRGFINSFIKEEGVILDEIQRTPDLLSYIQGIIDSENKSGFFILTGSENILISQHIGQSLAGRIALVTLLPLSLKELEEATLLPESLNQVIYHGFYPRLFEKKIDVNEWIRSYINTYIERDVRNLKNIGDLALFQKFIKLCAGRVGQLIDLTSIGNDCGITAHTVRSWLSILEATYILFILRPHYVNFNKRLTKSGKLYFYDTAIACQLLSIASPDELSSHYLKGGVFESMVISDLLKQQNNLGLSSNLYFWRDKSGLEVDCLVDQGTDLIPIEIKSGETINQDFFKNIEKWNILAGRENKKSYVIFGGSELQKRSKAILIGWRQAADFYG